MLSVLQIGKIHVKQGQTDDHTNETFDKEGNDRKMCEIYHGFDIRWLLI